MLESALTLLLEGRHIYELAISNALKSEDLVYANALKCEDSVYAKFWSQLQMLLKRMLAMTLPANTNKSSLSSQQGLSGRSADVGKLKELYKMSLKSKEYDQLNAMHQLWTS